MAKLAVCVSILLMLVAVTWASTRTACCTTYQKKPIPVRHLRNYTIQEDTGGCRLKAIIFQTKLNRHACGDPYQQWVIDAMKAIVSRNNGVHPRATAKQ